MEQNRRVQWAFRVRFVAFAICHTQRTVLCVRRKGGRPSSRSNSDPLRLAPFERIRFAFLLWQIRPSARRRTKFDLEGNEIDRRPRSCHFPLTFSKTKNPESKTRIFIFEFPHRIISSCNSRLNDNSRRARKKKRERIKARENMMEIMSPASYKLTNEFIEPGSLEWVRSAGERQKRGQNKFIIFNSILFEYTLTVFTIRKRIESSLLACSPNPRRKTTFADCLRNMDPSRNAPFWGLRFFQKSLMNGNKHM